MVLHLWAAEAASGPHLSSPLPRRSAMRCHVASIRSPASTPLGLAPLALTAWIGKSWTRLPQGHGNGVVPVVLISFSFVRPAWRPLFRVADKSFWPLSCPATQRRGSHWVARRENRENIANINMEPARCTLSRRRSKGCALPSAL